MNAWPIVLVPAAAALLGLVVGRDVRLARATAVAGSGLTLLLAIVGWAGLGELPHTTAGPGLLPGPAVLRGGPRVSARSEPGPGTHPVPRPPQRP